MNCLPIQETDAHK